jgi:hypothetical protein
MATKKLQNRKFHEAKKYFALYFINCPLSVRRNIFQIIVEGDINVIYTSILQRDNVE